jgi:ligand-binding sensor domain-containing protein
VSFDSVRGLNPGLEEDSKNEDRTKSHGSVGEANGERIVGIAEDEEERLLIASERGVFTYSPPKSAGMRGEWRRLPLKSEQPHQIEAVLVDRAGRLWIGTSGGGICKLSRDGIVSYTQTEGLHYPTSYVFLKTSRGASKRSSPTTH